MDSLTREEQETHFNQTAIERAGDIVNVYTDDPVVIRRLERDGWTGIPEGVGMKFVCEKAYMRVGRRRKRDVELTDEQRLEIAERLKSGRDSLRS